MTAFNRHPRKLDPQNWNTNFRPLLINLALKKVNDYYFAEDLVQETFIAAWKARNQFRGDCSEKTFLTRVLKNKVIDFYRHRGRRPLFLSSTLENDETDDLTAWIEKQPDKSLVSNPVTIADYREFKDDLEKAIENLPGKMGQAFRLREVEGLPAGEVIRALDITTSNLWVLVHRAKKALKSELQEKWGKVTLSFRFHGGSDL